MAAITTQEGGYQVFAITTLGAEVIRGPQVASPATLVNTTVSGCGQSNQAMISFYGAGADNATGTATIIGWRQNVATGVWMPHAISKFTVTLGAVLGVGASAPSSSQRMVDLIGSPTYGPRVDYSSPDDGGTAYILLDHLGSQLIEVQLVLGTATGLGCSIKFV